MKGAPRKLRKSCSLASCSKTPGECMHCTCDGRCGQHEGGHCGVRREGNGKSCKRDGCHRDESCLHSTRATCCHCRNLVSSSNRSSRKRTRAESSSTGLIAVSAPPPQKELLLVGEQEKRDDDGTTSPTSCDALLPLSADFFFDMCDEIIPIKKQKIEVESVMNDEDEESVTGTVAETEAASIDMSATLQTTEETNTVADENELHRKALCEYEQWATRRSSCNLVVIVEGTQFNLHKHPMLLESQLLNAKARESVVTTQSPVPVIQLPMFPGGAAAFEAVCVYAYTGELSFRDTEIAASLYCAVHYLNMGLAAKTLARQFLASLTQSDATIACLLRVTQQAVELAAQHHTVPVCQELQMECVDAVARLLPMELAAQEVILSLPCELFLQITMEMLATRGTDELVMDPVRQLCVQAELAQIHREMLEKSDASASARCLHLLMQSLARSSPPQPLELRGIKTETTTSATTLASATAVNNSEDDDDALFMKMMYEFELEPTSELGETSGGFADVLSATTLEPFAFGGGRGVASSSHRMLSEAFAV